MKSTVLLLPQVEPTLSLVPAWVIHWLTMPFTLGHAEAPHLGVADSPC
jgi:hypothetical protein